MGNSIVNMVGLLFATYIVIGGALVMIGKKRVSEIIIPLLILLVALSILPGLTSSIVQSVFKIISVWWVIGICAMLLIGIGVMGIRSKKD